MVLTQTKFPSWNLRTALLTKFTMRSVLKSWIIHYVKCTYSHMLLTEIRNYNKKYCSIQFKHRYLYNMVKRRTNSARNNNSYSLESAALATSKNKYWTRHLDHWNITCRTYYGSQMIRFILPSVLNTFNCKLIDTITLSGRSMRLTFSDSVT